MNFISYISNDGDFCDGEYILPLLHCKKHHNKGKCLEFYNSLKDKEKNKFYTCPYGMSVYPSGCNIYTCMRERSTYKKDIAKQISSQKTFNPVMDYEQLLILIESSSSISNKEILLNEKSAVVDSISHEVKQLNAQIKESCDVILQTYHLDEENIHLSGDDIKNIQKEIRNIYLSSSMISSRFSLYDYEKNPATLKQGAIFPCNIYKKFDKVRRILKNYRKKSTIISMSGTSFMSFDAYPTFELIPLLILENAVKYSYGKGGEVTIHVSEDNHKKLTVTITSYSPYCSREEISHIFDKGYRGKHAKRTSDGTGVGLYFVKMLCDIHNINITIQSDNTKISEVSGIPYAPFDVILEFTNVYSC